MLVLFLCASFASLQNVFSQTNKIHPIPSFNVLVNDHVYFQESYSSDSIQIAGKRSLGLTQHYYSSILKCDITFFVYSLDGLDYHGPYYLPSGQTIAVEIDNREWGVAVQSECDVQVDVWIDSEGLASESMSFAN